MKYPLAAIVAAHLVLAASTAWAGEPAKQTFIIEGLHCPPCTRTVERGLTQQPGVQSAKVEWSSKNAKVTFDEGKISAQQVAQAIAATPHMMGRGMHYRATLVLKVTGVVDEASGAKATSAIADIAGVAKVDVFAKQQALGVEFKPEGKVTTEELIAALAKAGFEAKAF